MTGQILDIALRSGVVYVIVLLGLRLLGKSHLSQLSILDFVLILLLSNAVQNAMVGNDSTLAGGIIAAVTLLGLNYLFSFLNFRSRAISGLFESQPTALVLDGKILSRQLRSEQISEAELLRAIREHGIDDVAEVKIALLEGDGAISIIAKGPHVRSVPKTGFRSSKFQSEKK